MTNKEKLINLEKEDKYVFHGSPDRDIELFELRQGKHKGEPDGRPAVSTTLYVEFAIFRAIINRKNISQHSSSFGITPKGEKEFIVSSKEILEQAKDKKGYVYIFNKKDFEPYDRNHKPKESNMEWRSYLPVKALDILEVTFADLPNIDRIKIEKIS